MSIHTKIKAGLFIVAAFLCMAYIAGPKPDFVVYYVQGNAKKINASPAHILKKGEKLYNTDMISIARNAQVILICKNYNNIKLNTPDTIRLSSLAGKCSASNGSFSVAYFHFLWDEFVDKKTDEQEYLHNIGAVSRGNSFKTPFFIDTINYYSGGRLTIKLDKTAGETLLKVFTDEARSKLALRKTVTVNGFNLDSVSAKLTSPGVYYWTAAGYTPTTTNYYLKIWDKTAYKKAVDDILSTVTTTDAPETAYMKGFMLEKNCFLTEALKYYKVAATLQPTNNIYKTAYLRFL